MSYIDKTGWYDWPEGGIHMDNDNEIKEILELWKKVPKELRKSALEQLRLLLHEDDHQEKSSE